MRGARILKYLSYGVIVSGALYAFGLFGRPAVRFSVAILLSVIIWCVLRVIANIAQIAFDIKAELFRILNNLERSGYRINASVKEIRDMMDANMADKK